MYVNKRENQRGTSPRIFQRFLLELSSLISSRRHNHDRRCGCRGRNATSWRAGRTELEEGGTPQECRSRAGSNALYGSVVIYA